ncbi:preprotein translocase subunit YajC [Candidatus Enterococcus clewellii]|uniref:Preprotein translocase, YajC subunit n=1 Tax=Candidatus Enterococcus clewellii TaxID=1834193 RepID=A0A242K5F2_9ENTE|nr:preprotein translocase subunit YajC [Enterococcus sp. 9E7_DIV0242]OTP13614.1 preprotein translocase, YajC subunit [Enterococcus sp. 9E7_DIV0242]
MGGGITMIFTLVLLGGMMFWMSRSQKKQQQERQSLLNSMKVGDKVVTIGGLHGVISEMDNISKTVFIDCEGIVLEFDQAAIRTVKPNTAATPTETPAVEQESVVLEKQESIAESGDVTDSVDETKD